MTTIVGIDVSKNSLEISNVSDMTNCLNDEKSIVKLINKLKKLYVSLVAFEATGGYEGKLSNALAKANIPMAIVNANSVRSFANAMNVAKTDKIDAKIIARFAEVAEIKAQSQPDPNQKDCNDLITRRRQLIDIQTAEKNRLEHASKVIAKDINSHLSYLEKQIDKIDSKLQQYLQSNESWKRKSEILQSVPGVGPVLTMTILSNLPEIGTLSNKQIAKLVGVAPINKDSGKVNKKRTTIGGRMEIKGVLYMATMNATKHNPILTNFYQRLVKAGKVRMVALVASMRKMITILNSMIKHDEIWNHKTNQS